MNEELKNQATPATHEELTALSDFADEVKDVIMHMMRYLLPNLEIVSTVVTKINDQKLVGLTFNREGRNASPTIYVNPYYERYQKGEATETLAAEITELFLRTSRIEGDILGGAGKVPDGSDGVPSLSYEDIKDKLVLRLLEVERNHDYLSEVPFVEVGDGLAIVCCIQLTANDEGGVLRTTITNVVAKEKGYDLSELFFQALRSAPIVDPPILADMDIIVQPFMEAEGDETESGVGVFNTVQSANRNLLDDPFPIKSKDKQPMYVLTTESGIGGAAALFYPGVKQQIVEKLGEGFFAIPSSIHEFLIVPFSAKVKIIDLEAMLWSGNETITKPGEVLSDKVLVVTKGSVSSSESL